MKPLAPRHCAAAAAFLLSAATSTWAAPDILLDDFSSPSTAQNALGAQDAYTISTAGTFAGVAGQVRDATYFVDANGGNATATIGGGSARVSTATGTGGTFFIAYGSWAVNPYTPQVQGPALNLDLSSYHHFLLNLPQADVGIVANVVLYTSQPLNEPGAVYYTSAAADLDPAHPGGAVHGDLGFNNAGDSNFNFQHVDGIFIEIQAGQPNTSSGYQLANVTISAVPEPQSLALLASGLGVLAFIARRRALRA